MKLSKDKQKQMRNVLWNYFHPMHEHLGFENSSTIYDIVKVIIKKCKLTFRNSSEEKIFRDSTSSRIFTLLMNNKSKYYIKGLLCEPIATGDNGVTRRLGHFYIAKTEDEIKRVKTLSTKLIDGRHNMLYLRTAESYELLKQLEHNGNEDRKRLTNTKNEGENFTQNHKGSVLTES